MRELRLKAAHERAHGLQIMTIEQFAARLAGGFLLPIDKDRLRAAIQTALPKADLGELDKHQDAVRFRARRRGHAFQGMALRH